MNGKTVIIRNHAEATIQKADAISSGGRDLFLLPVKNLASGPAMPMRIAPYSKKASVAPKEDVKKPVASVWCT